MTRFCAIYTGRLLKHTMKFTSFRPAGSLSISSRYESRPTGYPPVLDRAEGSGKMPDLQIMEQAGAT